jgi:FkbM family methyltransferase
MKYIVLIFFGSVLFADIPYPSASEIAIAEEKVRLIHKKVKLVNDTWDSEYPEQVLTAMHLPSNARVLELGSNLGVNTCLIASILQDSRNLVTLECRPECIPYLIQNRNANRFHFHVENAALSKLPLIEKGWITIPSNEVPAGWRRINTISFEDLEKKYQIQFDTLVVDCEGAIYYILQNDPKILDNIRLIIIENDFQCYEHYAATTNLFKEKGFMLVGNFGRYIYNENRFHQAWEKK